MPRGARVVVPGCPHHHTQRGKNRQGVFFVDDDRRVYLELLREQSARFELAVTAYCLMTVAGPVLLQPAGHGALLAGDAVRGAEPGARPAGAEGVAIIRPAKRMPQCEPNTSSAKHGSTETCPQQPDRLLSTCWRRLKSYES